MNSRLFNSLRLKWLLLIIIQRSGYLLVGLVLNRLVLNCLLLKRLLLKRLLLKRLLLKKLLLKRLLVKKLLVKGLGVDMGGRHMIILDRGIKQKLMDKKELRDILMGEQLLIGELGDT